MWDSGAWEEQIAAMMGNALRVVYPHQYNVFSEQQIYRKISQLRRLLKLQMMRNAQASIKNDFIGKNVSCRHILSVPEGRNGSSIVTIGVYHEERTPSSNFVVGSAV